MEIVDYPYSPVKPTAALSSRLSALTVTVTTKVSNLELGVSEKYSLNVTQGGATLTADTIFGALRGLETFAQLVQWNGTVMLVPYVPIIITDSPAWPWRGMLIDTARHYQTVESIEKIIDSMSIAKLNVFHWHLTDAESFPIKLPSAPEFASKGAWNSKATYDSKDVDRVTKYALYRGIRVMPEIDTPGHTYSFGKSHPEMIVNCSKFIQASKMYPGINNVALNLTNPDIYPLLERIYGDIAHIFSDAYMHVGGDEVRTRCFDEFNMLEWMGAHGYPTNSSYLPLLREFRQKLSDFINTKNKKMVLWEEAIEEMLELGSANPLNPANSVAHVWLNDDYRATVTTMLKAGYPTLLSAGWYLDQQLPRPGSYVPGSDDSLIYGNATHYLDIDTWQDMYLIDPINGLGLTDAEKANFIGGEVAQWAEAVMGDGILTNIWPRAAAGAERLWRGADIQSYDLAPAYHRLIRFQCYLYQRGVPASGLRPSYCFSAAFNPPYVAGGHTIAMPIWGLVILGSALGVAILATIVFAAKFYNANKKLNTKAPYLAINGDE